MGWMNGWMDEWGGYFKQPTFVYVYTPKGRSVVFECPNRVGQEFFPIDCCCCDLHNKLVY